MGVALREGGRGIVTYVLYCSLKNQFIFIWGWGGVDNYCNGTPYKDHLTGPNVFINGPL